MFRGGLGTPEIILILAVVVLLFGAKKLPDLARGSGRALRIFKAETKGLIDGDDDETSAPKPLESPGATTPIPTPIPVQTEVEPQAKPTD